MRIETKEGCEKENLDREAEIWKREALRRI